MSNKAIKPQDFGAIPDLPQVVLYADGARDDSKNYELVANGKATAVHEDGRLFSGGTVLISKTIVIN